jgi:Zn-dependent oligopeptidase
VLGIRRDIAILIKCVIASVFQLDIHVGDIENNEFLATRMSAVTRGYIHSPLSVGNLSYCAFPHLAFETYASRYYSYLFSSVICLDVLQEFLNNGGVLDLGVATRYRKLVLQKVGSSSAERAVARFLGI